MLSVHQERSRLLVHIIKIPTFIPIRFLQHRFSIFLGENRQKFKPKNSMPGGDDNILALLFHELGKLCMIYYYQFGPEMLITAISSR